MPRICDLLPEQVVVGIRIKGMVQPDRFGTIVEAEEDCLWRDNKDYHYILWDDRDHITVGFWFNECECEIVEDNNN